MLNCIGTESCKWKTSEQFEDQTLAMCEAKLISNYTISKSSENRMAKIKNWVQPSSDTSTNHPNQQSQNRTAGDSHHQPKSVTHSNTLTTSKSLRGNGFKPEGCHLLPFVLQFCVLFVFRHYYMRNLWIFSLIYLSFTRPTVFL